RRTLATVLTEDADLRKELGDDLGAEENYKEAHAITRSIADGDPDDISKREEVLLSAWKLAAFAQSQNDDETFRNIAAQTLADAENLLKAHPTISKLKFAVAYAQRVMAQASFNNDRDAFVRHSEAACAGYAALVRANPENFENCSHELYSRLLHAEGLADIGRGKVAMARVKEVLADLDTLGDTPEKAGRLSGQKSACLKVLSAIHHTFGEFDAAHAAHLEALEIVRARYEEAPAITARRANFVRLLTEYGDLLKAANRTEDARTCYQEALDLYNDRSNAPKQTEQTNRLVALSRLGDCANAMGNSELAGQYRAECLGIVEAQAEEERNYTAQSNLSKAYLAEATESIRVGQWAEAETWIAKSKEVSRKVTEPKNARQLQQRLADAELEIALHNGDKAESRKYIDMLVAMAAENEAEQSTLTGQLNLCDLLIRQASLHDEYGQDNPIIPRALAALTAADSCFAGNELARSSLVSVWERMGHLYGSVGQLSNAIAAFEKALALRSQEDHTEKPLGVANTRIALSEILFAADDIDRAQQELAKVEALIPAIRNFYDLPRFAIYQEYKVAHISAAIAMFLGDMARAREHASQAEAAAHALEMELPNHGDPFLHLFNAIDHEIEALWIEQAMDRAEPIYERLYEMSEKADEIFANDRVAEDIRAYLALVRSRIDNAAGKHAEAKKAAQDGVEVVQRSYENHAAAFRKTNLGRLRSAAANAFIALGDVQSAVAFQRDAVADFEFVNSHAPEVKENARRHLRSLFDLARLTDDEDCFDQVALKKRNLEETGSLPKHYFWVKELNLEERLTIRAERSN
ncbi:MAG: hypothetical protein WBC85_01920, partial [Planktotalea sp.]|uniref:hypothetical protein n=1 Tax=Planktotalea sp. TaxID=2029877 RepID=UPI003C73768F